MVKSISILLILNVMLNGNYFDNNIKKPYEVIKKDFVNDSLLIHELLNYNLSDTIIGLNHYEWDEERFWKNLEGKNFATRNYPFVIKSEKILSIMYLLKTIDSNYFWGNFDLAFVKDSSNYLFDYSLIERQREELTTGIYGMSANDSLQRSLVYVKNNDYRLIENELSNWSNIFYEKGLSYVRKHNIYPFIILNQREKYVNTKFDFFKNLSPNDK